MAQIAATMAVYTWQFDDAEFDEGRRELCVAGHKVDLEPRPLEILLQLLRHAGAVVTKEDLLDAVYGHRHLSDGAITQAVRRLRRALNDHDQKIIATVHRVGYQLIAEVRRTEISAARTRPLLLKVGDHVPRREHWRLVQPLGGDAVEVWLIEHEKTHARRVLKLATDAVKLSALKREVTLYRVLKQCLGERTDLCALIDWNFESSPYFIECEYGGITLSEWAAALGGLATIPMAARIELIACAADAVGAAHGANVLHKDLKPSNILAYQSADATWRARLIDFGSGRLLDADRLDALRITQQGFTHQLLSGAESMSGTPLYLAPELLAGHMPAAKSDVYALGVILYQLVVGDFRKPIASGWEDDIPDPFLREDIASATHGNPSKRLNSAQDLARRLRDLPDRRLQAARLASAIDSRPTSPFAPTPARRGGRSAAVTASITAVVTASVVFAAWQFGSQRRPAEIPWSEVASKDSIDAYQRGFAVYHQRHESRSDELDSAKTLERAVETSPRFANAWALLAQVNAHLCFNHYETDARRVAATQALQKATELQPNAPDTLIAQGYLQYWIEGDYVAAARTMQRVHEQWPDNPDATIALARIARRQNRPTDAARYFEEALAHNRLNMEWALGAANARLILGQFTAAGQLASHALDIEPTDVQAIGLKALVFQAQGDLSSASTTLRALATRPGDFATARLLAEQARLERRSQAAIATWRTYLAAPDSVEDDDTIAAKQELAHLLLLTSDSATAKSLLREVRDALEQQRGSRPADPWPMANLALVYADLDEPVLARTLSAAAASFEVVKNDATRASRMDVILAKVATHVGDNDRAFDILSHLLSRPANDVLSVGLLSIDPGWDSLRPDARFAALTARAPRLAAISAADTYRE